MSFSLHPEAAEEFEDAVEWYEERSPGLGLDFAAEIRQAIRRAESMPFAWTRIEGDIRRVLTHRFPYGILYAPDGDHLHILAVMHLSRAPGYWRHRA
jgi:plasmid stabilization system protein ParE